MNENTINERKKTDIGTGVQMSKNYNTIALLRRAKMGTELPLINWAIVNWTLSNKLQWNFNENTKSTIHESASKISFVKWQPSCPGRNALIYMYRTSISVISTRRMRLIDNCY